VKELDDIVRARDGDRQAGSRVFGRYWRPVYFWMLARVRRPELAEDLTQQVFLRAWSRMGQLRKPESFPAWLRRIVRTIAFGRRQPVEHAPRREFVGRDAAALAAEAEERRAVSRALSHLSQRERTLLFLFYFEDLPLAQVARLAGMPVTTTRRRLAKALGSFERALSREGGHAHEVRERP
jgi:RNA polymerase sigma-70 factor (ECF subfamily)